MTLNAIDVSRYQAGMNIGATGADAIIVGITYGSIGVNPYAADEIARAHAAGKLVGLYHIRAGDGPTPAAEAQHFLDNATQYLDGRTVIFLDWEECTLSDVPWALAWCMYVLHKTGILPVMYMSASVSLAYDWSSVRAANIGLWVAQYPYNTVAGFVGVSWTPPATSWPNLVGWQYAGTGGSVGPYVGLDLSVFYITAAQWAAYGAPHLSGQSTTVTPIPEDELPLTPADVALIWGYQNTAAGDTTDMHGVLVNAAATTPAAIWAYKNQTAGDATDMHGALINAAAAKSAATQASVTTLVNAVTALQKALEALPAAVLNQTFTTAAGVKTNVPGLLDAINTKPSAAVALTADQIATIAAQLGPANIKALAAQLSK